ncbi:MAG: septal ring lytic transglycosylase RlpA family protein [Wolinella sp.]
MSSPAKISTFVLPIFLLGGCVFKPSPGPSRTYTYGEPAMPNMEDIRDTPQMHKATMRPYQIAGKWYYPSHVDVGDSTVGIASWYGPNFHGKKTSNGETYSMYAHTAAHKTYPMNTVVKVTNRENGKSTIVRINDRGPFVEGRIIDLSNTAAHEIDMVQKGTALVTIEVLGFSGVIANSMAKNLPEGTINKKEFRVGSVESSVTLSRFLVQIGAFRKKDGAERFKAQNSNVGGYKAVVREFMLDGAPIYRVMLSGFKGEEEARDFIAREKIVSGAFVISE